LALIDTNTIFHTVHYLVVCLFTWHSLSRV